VSSGRSVGSVRSHQDVMRVRYPGIHAGQKPDRRLKTRRVLIQELAAPARWPVPR
jgi:hypothetical protein